MCIVSVKIDENALRTLMPELDSETAICHWAQDLIDWHLKFSLKDDVETMDVEEMRAMLHETVRTEYAHK